MLYVVGAEGTRISIPISLALTCSRIETVQYPGPVCRLRTGHETDTPNNKSWIFLNPASFQRITQRPSLQHQIRYFLVTVRLLDCVDQQIPSDHASQLFGTPLSTFQLFCGRRPE
jgi:hypothetical protein